LRADASKPGEGLAHGASDVSPLTRSLRELPSPARGEGETLVLFALEREAAPFRRAARDLPHVSIHVSGIGRERAGALAEQVVAESPALVIAAGFCGALVPTLRVGDIVTSPRILTVDHLVADPAEKRRLAESHDALAVDMESAAIEEVCAQYGVPFLAVRAVSDTADTALSPELVRLLSGSKVSVWKAIRALVRRPRLLGEFRRLARDTKLAAEKLAGALVRIPGERGA
jgi:adenosylhomocysteine nucleosidase